MQICQKCFDDMKMVRSEKVIKFVCASECGYEDTSWKPVRPSDTNGRLISAEKLLYWIENSNKADGFWLGTCAVEAFDNLKDSIETGQLDFDSQATMPRHIDEWHEDKGDVLWWAFPIEEPPYCGTPLDSNWPDYHTHWTPILLPEQPHV